MVLHPGKTEDAAALLDQFHEAASRHAGTVVGLFLTTPSDSGAGAAHEALQQRPDVVIACGGDGTVNAVASTLAHGDVPLGIVPLGTGNLVARNLDIPLEVEDALDVALGGSVRRVDMGVAGGHRFVGMAGMGLDAVMSRDADPRLKKTLGWPAYVRPIVRAWRAGPVPMEVRCDDETWAREPLLAVVVGNVGRLQGGLPLLPDAEPDDGVLDAALVRKAGPRAWLTTARDLLTRRSTEAALEVRAFRRLELRSRRRRPFEVDGDPVGETDRLLVEVDPQALQVMVPAWDR